MHSLFVYGTLRAGLRNHHHLAGATALGEARTEPAFTLVDLGRCPGLQAGGATAIVGEVFAVDEVTLARVDALERHPEWYVRTEVVLADGRRVATYVLPDRFCAGLPVIASGDWMDCEPRDWAPLPEGAGPPASGAPG